MQFAPDAVIPSMLQSSVGVEREIHPKTTVGVTAISTRGYDLFRSRDINAPLPPLFVEPSRSDARRRSGDRVGRDCGARW